VELLIIVLVVLVVGGYWLSLHLHPYAQCEACKGTGKHRGALFGYAHRPCHKCSGNGRKQRSGAAGLNLGEPRKGRNRWY
jgi:DnaJ-class molecular chaperone